MIVCFVGGTAACRASRIGAGCPYESCSSRDWSAPHRPDSRWPWRVASSGTSWLPSAPECRVHGWGRRRGWRCRPLAWWRTCARWSDWSGAPSRRGSFRCQWLPWWLSPSSWRRWHRTESGWRWVCWYHSAWGSPRGSCGDVVPRPGPCLASRSQKDPSREGSIVFAPSWPCCSSSRSSLYSIICDVPTILC